MTTAPEEWSQRTKELYLDGEVFLDKALALAATLGEKTEDAESELTDKVVGSATLRQAWLVKWFLKA